MTEPADELEDTRAPLLDHLIELRKRLIYCIVALVVTFFICFYFSEAIFAFLLQPLKEAGQSTVIYTQIFEAFFVQVKVAFFAAMMISFPIIANQFWQFVAPGLYKKEKRAFIPYLIATPVFFLLGALMVYFVVLPMALHFFAGMQTNEIKMLTSVSEYLGLAMTLIIAFGICFQLPVILTLLAQIDLINSSHLKHGRRYAIVAILALAALLTPPDPISQIGLATPLYLLYELSILSVRWVERSRAKKLAEEAAQQSN